MSEEHQTTAREIIALAMAKARTSPPEYATASAYDLKMADHVLKTLASEGWRLERAE